MKPLNYILLAGLFICFVKQASADFTRDTLSLFSKPYTADSFEVYLSVKGTWASICTRDCYNSVYTSDTVLFNAGYYLGNATVTCRVTDTFYLGIFPTGIVNVKAKIGGSVIVNCDSFYTNKVYTLSLLLSAANIEDEELTGTYLFPNPSADYVEISGQYFPQNTKVQIYSSTGQSVNCSIATTSKSIKVDISNLPSGLYYLQYQDEKQRLIKRFVKY